MRKQRNILRFTAILLAFLIGFSSTGYAIDLHYCQGHLKTFSFFGKAKNCHELKKKNPTCHHSKKQHKQQNNQSIDKSAKDCCHNHTVKVEADDHTKLLQDADIEIQTTDWNIPLNTPINIILKKSGANELTKVYKPPLILRNMQVLFEVFLL
jgi:hypothetical protein